MYMYVYESSVIINNNFINTERLYLDNEIMFMQ